MDNKEATKTIIFFVLLIVLGAILFARFSTVPAVGLPEPTINPPVEESDICYSGRNVAPAMPAGIADATLSITASRYSFQSKRMERIIFDESEAAAPPKAKETPQPAEEPQAETLEAVVVNEEEVEMLACLIYQEAGGNAASDTVRYMVGDVVLNRIESDKFPNTMQEVLTQRGQYGRFYWTGIKWMDRATDPSEAAAVQRAYDTARDLLAGNHSEIYGQGYIWQAEFPQGTDVIHIGNLYFGR